MKKILTLLLFSFLISCSENKKLDCNYITDYYPIIYKAEVQYQLQNYQKAFKLYQEAFSSCKPKNTPIYYEMKKYAELATILGKEKLALDYIEKNLKSGQTLKSFTNDSVFNKILKTDRGKKLVENYPTIREKYLNGLNLKLRNEIQEMRKWDQSYIGVHEKRDSIFRVNTKRLIEIFEEKGYPGIEMVGPYNIDFSSANISIMLLHTNDSIRVNYFIPKLKEYVKEGICPPITLGVVIDNLHIYNDELQIMGTYENREENMISDLEQVDKNRISIGLPPLKLKEKIDSLRGY